MLASFTGVGLRILCNRLVSPPPVLFHTIPLLRSRLQNSIFMEIPNNPYAGKSSFTASAHSSRGGGRGRGLGMKEYGQRSRGGGRGSSGNDKIDALGRLLTCILRHMASELKLDMRSDGYVKVQDLLKLNLKTFANIPLQSHTADEVKEAVRRDNKQRFSILEDNGELLILCVHGTYKKNLESILEGGLKRMKRLHVHFSCGLPTDGEVISVHNRWIFVMICKFQAGMRRDVNVLIFLDVRKALEEGMKLYISDNKVILTEGFDGAVPVKYFKKIESWPKREPIPFQKDF
ncbi:tRNA 2'-phosphotransferase [Striga asiatica]|uniref:2'-phosphotransferase n=1 Tax=Striga asiatica TaxID=4170 RepID=A0A5A7P1H6_STRAF|nr:tRNA 2'-phosphotransferase [Striga asiatica]